MPGYVNIEGRYTNWYEYNINGRTYKVLDPRQLLFDIVKYRFTPRDWDLKTIILVGPQGSGKSTLIRYIVDLIRNNPDYSPHLSVISTNDIRILSDKRYANHFQGSKVMVLIVDDVIREGFDSRRAMSSSNVGTTQQFCITRHVLRENFGPKGIIFIIFATQIYSRIDPTIREPATIQIFTSYYDQKWFLQQFSPEDLEFLRIKTYEGMVASQFDSRRFALVKTLTGDVATIEVPFLSSKDVPIPYIDRTINKDKVIDDLSRSLITRFSPVVTAKKNVLKGYLNLEAKKFENEYCLALSKSDLVSVINRAIYYEYQDHPELFENGEYTENSSKYSTNPNNLTIREKIIKFLELHEKAKIADIASGINEKYDSVKSQLNQHECFVNIAWGLYTLKGTKYDTSLNETQEKGVKT